eukprot:scaffold255376_cov33-Tisochrysis_lutea.AAC.1
MQKKASRHFSVVGKCVAGTLTMLPPALAGVWCVDREPCQLAVDIRSERVERYSYRDPEVRKLEHEGRPSVCDTVGPLLKLIICTCVHIVEGEFNKAFHACS